MSRTARLTDRRSLALRASHLALAGILLTGWSVAAVAVSASANASVVAEDSEPADETADAPGADTPAAEAPTGSDTTDTANDSGSSETNADDPADSTDPADGEPAPEGTESDEDIAPDEDTGLDEELTDEEAGLDEELTDEESGLDEELTDEESGLDEELVDGELVDGELDSGVESDASVSLQIAGTIGAQAAGTSISVTASGLMPQSRALLLVFSEARSLGEAIADDTGTVSMSATLPADLGEGVHTVVFEGYDVDGNPVENATQIVIDADGLIAGINENASTEGLDIPEFSADPMVPAYPLVVPLDDPEFVASKSVTALTLLTVAGVGLGAAVGATRSANGTGLSGSGGPGGGGPGGGGIDTAVRTRADDLDDANEWNAHRGARLSLALAGFSGILPRVSPLLSRIVSDAAPLRAFTGNLSFLLPLTTLLLGIFAASSVGGLAEPAAAAFLLPLMVIGVFDALAGLVGALSFTVVVAVSGGLVNASSVRSVIGVGLVIAGPGIIASSFRDIRRKRAIGSAAAWERLTDLVVVPLIGAWTTIAIISALPDLGGLDFPIADQARLFGLVALVALVAKVLIEEAAARWVPARMSALSATNPAEPGTTQQVISALVRTSAFLFIAAAFVGNVWQLWVAALLFMLPGLLALIAHVFPNSPRLWQILPEGIPLFAVMLVIGLIVTSAVKSVQGDSPEFAQMSFLWMAVPGFLLALLGLTAREPREGDVRWYMRPAMTNVYRVGGIVVLVIAVALGLRG
jgi:hypothetical protein